MLPKIIEYSLQVTIKMNLLAELKHQAPNKISNSSDSALPPDMFRFKTVWNYLGQISLINNNNNNTSKYIILHAGLGCGQGQHVGLGPVALLLCKKTVDQSREGGVGIFSGHALNPHGGRQAVLPRRSVSSSLLPVPWWAAVIFSTGPETAGTRSMISRNSSNSRHSTP